MKTFKAIAFLTILISLSLSAGYVFAEPPAEPVKLTPEIQNAAELGHAVIKNGAVNLGEKEDRFTSESLAFKVTPPPNWHKASEVLLGSGAAPALIVYSKTGKEIAPPVMAITRDTPGMQDKRAVEFTVRMKAVISKTLPDVVFDGPSEEIINGRDASHMVFKGQTPKGTLRTEWYQFLEKGTIITFDFTSFDVSHAVDLDTFRALVYSFQIE